MSTSDLKVEIEKASLRVSTDDFQMSIGEIANLYRDGDIIINPNFQRFFRWDIGRKSKLIESVFLGIPIPPIFLFELPDSRWEVIDGLQRLSTLLEFMGLLRDADTKDELPGTGLVGTQYLPSLKGAYWDQSFIPEGAEGYALDAEQQRAIKRTKLGLQILEKKSDSKSKFDLFQRLNSGGLTANAQEIRNCIIVMSNERFFEIIGNLTKNNNFSEMVPLGPLSKRKANDFELISRIVAFGFRPYESGVDIEDFVNNAIVDIASQENEDFHTEMKLKIEETFQFIRTAVGVNGLRPYSNGVFQGRIGRTSIEIV